MAEIRCKKSLQHSVSSVDGLLKAFDGVNKLSRNKLRCDSAGDKFAQKIFKNNTGSYAALAKAFEKIYNLSEKALENGAFNSTGTKAELTEAKIKAKAQMNSCKNHQKDFQIRYDLTADIISNINANM